MKRYLRILLLMMTGLALVLSSWGYKGHRAVATIAQKHLTGSAPQIVSLYLQGKTMADVSTWADENRDQHTASWHYLDLPLGLSFGEFKQAVLSSGPDNVYAAILATEKQVKDGELTVAERTDALKYLIHLVGDAHQPMHVSRKEDRGGNTIQLRFDDKGTNLHSLWDSKLIDHEGLSESDIAKTYDTATPAMVKQWQADEPMQWLWESYQISSELYASARLGQTIDDAYYQKYITIIRKRIDQAGIRLAGELNKLFANEKIKVTEVVLPPPPIASPPVPAVPVQIIYADLKDVRTYIGKEVKTTGKVYGVKDIGSMVLVNLGAPYPSQLLTVALKGDAKTLAISIDGKTITVIGKVIEYKGRPEIVVESADQLLLK